MEHNNHYTILANIDSRRHVSICEHGTVHLTWGMTTFRFRPKDFAYLARILDEKAGMPDGAPCDEPICLSSNAESVVTLRILEFGVFLSPVDFLLLVDMVTNALQRLNTLPFESTPPAPIVISSRTDTPVFFSSN